jgi:hypothetical protein
VNADLERSTYDHELDARPRRPARGPVESLTAYQRLLVNPLLTVSTWVAVAALIRLALRRQDLTWFLTGIVLLFVPPLLVRFHCCDCGGTGWLLRYRRHACSPVVSRWQGQQVARSRWPGVGIQVMAWLYVLIGALLLVLIVIVSRR